VAGEAACLVQAELSCGGLAVWAGGPRSFAEPGTPPSYAPDRGFDIAHIGLHLAIDAAAGTLRGRARIDLRPLPGGLGEVALDLDDVDVDGVTDDSGAALAYRYGDGRLQVKGLPPEGGVVVVAYHGRPQRGLYFTGPTAAHPRRPVMAWTQCQDEDAHFIFPCLDRPGVRHPWTITVQVLGDDADAMQVVGNGRLAERQGATWTWQQDDAIPAYLLTVVVGPLMVVEDRAVVVGGRSVPIRYLVPAVDNDGEPADEAVVRRAFGGTPDMVAFLSDKLGVPYAWPRYDQVVVHDFIFGGMENAAATTMTDLILTSDRAALDVERSDLVVHELMHQWFGDLVTCQDWSQGWLNEGWATWSEYLWKLHAEGAEEADWHQWAALSAYLDEDGSRYRRAIVSYRFREPIDVFDRHLYQKASLVIHTLHGLLGPAAFWTGVRAYLDDNRFGPVHTRDFQRALERASGRNLDGFFAQWILGAGHPTLTVSLSHADGLLQVEVEQTQQPGLVADDPEQVVAAAFDFVLPLAVVHGDQVAAHRLRVRGRKQVFVLPCGDAPTRVEVDADLTVLADITVKAPRDWLAASLRQDRGIVGRIRAARALAADGSPDALAKLVDALGSDDFWGVRAEVAKALGKHGGAKARDALLATLNDEHPKVRRAVAEALAAVGDAPAAGALLARALAGDPSLLVEGACAAAVGGLAARGQVDADETLAVLCDVLDRKCWGDLLAQRALSGIGALRSDAALPVLLARTGPAHGERIRAAAAQALGQLAEEHEPARRAAVDRLMALAVSGPWRVRFMALGALGRARDPRARAVLLRTHASALEGRLRRTAWEASQRLAASSSDPVAGLREEVEKLRRESQELRGRLDGLAGKVDAGRVGDGEPSALP